MQCMVRIRLHEVKAAQKIAHKMKRSNPITPMIAPTIHTHGTLIQTPMITTIAPRMSSTMAMTSRTPHPDEPVVAGGGLEHAGIVKLFGAGGVHPGGMAGPLTVTATA